MKKPIGLIILISLFGCSGTGNIESEKQVILTVIYDQQKAWNSGDLESYMQGYWKSDSLRFIGSKGIRYGWKATLEGYQKSYPDTETMGQLVFSDIRIDIISDSTAFVIGKWLLKRKNDEPNGYFTLLWKKINGSWVIVVDHSS